MPLSARAAGPALSIALALHAGAATAQAADPAPAGFDAAIDRVLADAGEERTLVHCAGLFRAFTEVATEGSDLRDLAAGLEVDMAVFATAVRESETGATMEQAMDGVATGIYGVAELYVQRIRGNVTAGDGLLDPGMEETIAYCRDLRDRLTEATR